MTREQFKTGDSPFIRVETCDGDLIIRGWAEPILQIKGEYRLEETEKGHRITSSSSLYLTVPRDAVISAGRVGGSLNVKQFTGTGDYEYVHGDTVLSQANDNKLGVVHGDLIARNLLGDLSVEEVNGDMVARGVGQTRAGAVHGDLTARVVDGGLIIEAIHGDADLRTVNGDVHINQGYRDVNLKNIGGQVVLAGVMGDIRLRGGLANGDHSLEARGDIVVRWPAGMPINLNVTANRIDNRLQLDEVTEKAGSLNGHIGNGNTNLSLKTAGRIILREEPIADENWDKFGGDMDFDLDVEMDGIANRIQAEVNNHLSRVSRELETKFGADFGQQINEKIARKMEKATEKARRRMETRGRGFDFYPTPASSAKKPTSTEEQLKILKMVETGKITPEEAGMLLEALEA